MHSKCRWEIEDVGGRGLEFSRPTERELDFLTARLSRGKKGEGGFFFVHIFDQPKKSDFLKKKHMSAFRIHPQGLHFQNATENAHKRKREMQFANALFFFLLLLLYPRARNPKLFPFPLRAIPETV